MADTTKESDQMLRAAGQSLQVQRDGGTHRPASSIGRGSAELKAQHLARKLVQVGVGVIAVLLAAGVVGAIIDGIGFWGVMLTSLAVAAVVGVVSTRRIKVPRRTDLKKGDACAMVVRTDLWPEHQRAALLAPAAGMVGARQTFAEGQRVRVRVTM